MDVLPEVPTAALEDAFWDARVHGDVPGQVALWNILRTRNMWRAQQLLIDVMLGHELDYEVHP